MYEGGKKAERDKENSSAPSLCLTVPFQNQLNSDRPPSMTRSLPGVDASFQNRDKHI